MATDLTVHQGGGQLVVTDGTGDLALHSQTPAGGGEIETQAQQPLMTDAEHFAAFRDTVVEAFAAENFREPAIVDKVVAAAQYVNEQMGRGSLATELPKVASAFGQQLVRQGLSDARALSTAMAVGFQYLLALQEMHEEARDGADRVEQTEVLKRQWGQNFGATVKAVRNFINNPTKFPVALADAMFGARDGEGRLLANSAATLEWIAGLALGQPHGAGGTGPSPDAMHARRKEIENIMRTDLRRYQRDPELRLEYERNLSGVATPSLGALRARKVEIERIMREDYRRYRRENLGAELQQIIEKLGG